MGLFQYKDSTWKDIPDYAHPDDDGTVLVVYPEASDMGLDGLPCGMVGLPYIRIAANAMLGTGVDWWNDRFYSQSDEYVAISITAVNPRDSMGTWSKWAGYLLRPVIERAHHGPTSGTSWFEGVTITVVRIVVTT